MITDLRKNIGSALSDPCPSGPSVVASYGIVFDIQRAALHDGPGLRTVVFLKGCPLRCAWCHNPESQNVFPETGRSGKVYGRLMTVDEVMQIVLKDRAYYKLSGGGMTLSGGEPTVQFEFCRALLQAAQSEGIHTCLDTCGQVASEKLLELIPFVDLFHYDLKVLDARAMREWTGGSAGLVRRNLDLLLERGCRVILRCPIVPGVNDTSEHHAALDAWGCDPRVEAVERLPYHDIGLAKAADLGREQPRFPVPALA